MSNEEDRSLVCTGTTKQIKCKIGTKEFKKLPKDNVKFNMSTLNNLSSVNQVSTKEGYMTTVTPDKHSMISCDEDWGKFGQELHCKAEGPRELQQAPAWENITQLDQMKELEGENAEKAREIFNNVLEESFPTYKDKFENFKIFEVPKLKGAAYAYSKLWVTDDNKVYPVIIGFSGEGLEDLDDETNQERFKMDLIHELTHISRVYGQKYEMKDVGVEEGETMTEALVRGDMKIRLHYPSPHGPVEEIVYVPQCLLPDQYCFESLSDAREFEEFNYEMVSGEEKPRPMNKNTPDWEEIEKRIPIAPIVDMMRGREGSYNPLTDVSTYHVVTQSPSGKKYLYYLADLHIDNQELSISDVLEGIDEFDAMKRNESVERVWVYP